MSPEDEEFLSTALLDQHEWHGVQELSKAMSLFEPLAKRTRLGLKVTERLISLGVAEKGYSDRYRADGFRLTELGHHVRERGRFPRRQR